MVSQVLLSKMFSGCRVEIMMPMATATADAYASSGRSSALAYCKTSGTLSWLCQWKPCRSCQGDYCKAPEVLLLTQKGRF